MALYQQIRETWKSLPKEIKQGRLVAWREEPVVVRVERPTRLDRARSLGYRAKQGILVARVRVLRGGRMRPLFKSGRTTKRRRRVKILDLNYQVVAEQRANKQFTNCEVLNSYPVGKDGKHYWFEVILVDRSHPAIQHDKTLSWITRVHGRVYRGLTSAGRKSRGLRTKGVGAEKVRPSRTGALRRKERRQRKVQPL